MSTVRRSGQVLDRHAFVVCLLALSAGWTPEAALAQTPAGPNVVSLSPGSGVGAGRTFTFAYSDPDGASDIATTEGLIVSGTDLVGLNACYFFTAGNQVWLRDDGHSAWIGPMTAGRSETVSNSQCTLAAAGSSIAASGNSLVTTVTVTFTASFAGPKTIYMRATDRAGLASDFIQGGTWTVSPLNPGMNVVTSSCADSSRDGALAIRTVTEQGGKVSAQVIMPDCFRTYANYLPQEGYFLDGDRHPLPIMGRTCGHFDLLIAFVDTDFNRRKLLDNSSIPASIKEKIADGRIQEALTELFATYTTTAVVSGFRLQANAAKVVDFSFSVGVTHLTQRALDLTDGGLGFARYDAVVVLDDMGSISAHGVERWPSQLTRPLFHGRDGSFFLHIDPLQLTPALFGHELLHRNLPVLLKEYQIGNRTLVREGNVTYDRTPVINLRTGEDIEPLIRAYEGKTPLVEYIGGFGDVDGDGVVDCVDPEITPTADNVDGDFIPDRFDPDLRFDHRPYSWMYAARGILR
jgi:hypothetical protein